MHHLTTLSFSLLASLSLALPLYAQDRLGPVTPYRPSVSSPAQLPLAGQLELELGGLSGKTGDSRRSSLPYALKLGFTPEWGIVIEGEAYIAARDDDGGHARGAGDTTLVLKRAFLVDDATAFGLELGAKIPTARDTIGSGKADYSVNAIFSRDIARVHMDANLNLTRLGAYADDGGRIQTGWSAAFSVPLSERWDATAELSGTRLRGADSSAQFLLAATYSPNPRLAIDVGLARGLTPASPDWSLFSGLVVPLARVW
ncbi:transporter [Janthinobacterium agaricidamnosum]|uniref:Transporter n=1 Tax=Janthinobacterium agaricidamnosum NBRC 102515 = DSM 9628 TaxID=1349767 RepID=W0V6Q0_9BURK|nr:transporter [Janthinobacterium agaricidamnosum]CDG83556.1 hypothetical protein GJA_2930 [Janthinobacterium agaricidamnosum NBRC 102515 = DSM 9628]